MPADIKTRQMSIQRKSDQNSRTVFTPRTIAVLAVAVSILIVATGGAAAQSADARGSPDIEVLTPNNDVTPGAEDTVTVQINNKGQFSAGNPGDRAVVTTARGTVVGLNAGDAPIQIETGSQAVGDVTEDQPENVEFSVIVPGDATPGTYTAEVTVDYAYISNAQDSVGARGSINSDSRSISREIDIEVSADPRFRVNEVDSSLRVGEQGEITGQLQNVGGERASSVQVNFAPNSDTVIALQENVAVDNIPAGGSVRFTIPVEVTSDAEAIPREFDLPVTFRDEDGIRGEDDDPSFRVDIGESRDTLIVEPVNPTVSAGSTKSLDLRVTNNRDETLEDIEGKLFVDDPLDSANDETFTTALEPNETTTVTVDLSASEGATIKNYPVSMDFRYTDSDGDSKLTDSYRLSIDVTEPSDDGGGLPLGPLLIGLVVVAGAGGVLWRRQNSDTTDLSGLDNE